MIGLCANKARFLFLSSKPVTDVRRSRIIHWVRCHSSNFLSGKHVDSSFLPASTYASQLCDTHDAHSYPWLDCLLKQTFSDEGIITVGFSFDLSANSQSLCPWYYCSWCLSQTFISYMEFSMKNNKITCSKTKYISITTRISYDIFLWATRSGGACKKFFQKLLMCYILYELYTQIDS